MDPKAKIVAAFGVFHFGEDFLVKRDKSWPSKIIGLVPVLKGIKMNALRVDSSSISDMDREQ